MDAKQLLTELEALAEKLAVDVQYDKFTGEGARSGGLCKVRGRWRAIVERRSADTEKVSVLVRCLARFDFASQIISPELDKLLTRQANASKAAETVEGAENDNAEGAPPQDPAAPDEQPSPKEAREAPSEQQAAPEEASQEQTGSESEETSKVQQAAAEEPEEQPSPEALDAD